MQTETTRRGLPFITFAFAALLPLTFLAAEEDPLKNADAALAKKEFSTAAELLTKFLDSNPEDARVPEVQLKMVHALLGAGMPLRASTVVEKIIKQHPTHEAAAEARYLLGRCMEARGDFLKAIAYYKEYVRRHPDRANVQQVRHYIPKLYEEVLGRWPDAARDWLEYVQLYPKDANAPEILDHAGWLFQHKLRKVKEAVEIYRQVVRDYPNYEKRSTVQGNLAYTLEDGGLRDYPSAAQEYRNYLKWFPDAEGRYTRAHRLGWLLRDRLNQQANAVEAYEIALKAQRTPEAAWDRAEAIRRTGDREGALKAFLEFVKEYPDDYRIHETYRQIRDRQWELKQRDESLKSGAEIVERWPKDAADRWVYGEYARQHKQYPEAIKQFQACAECQPGYAGGTLYAHTAYSYLALEDADGAEKVLKDALEKFPQSPDIQTRSLWVLGENVYPAKKQVEQSIDAFKQICLKSPEYAHYANPDYSLARIEQRFNELKNPAGAVAVFDEIYQANPNVLNARFARIYAIRALLSAKKLEEAEAAAKALIDGGREDDAWGWANVLYGQIKGEQGDLLAQLESFALFPMLRKQQFGYTHRYVNHFEGQVINPRLNEFKGKDGPDSKLRYALCLHAKGQLAEATKLYEELLADEEFKGALRELAGRARAEVLAQQDRSEEAELELAELSEEKLYELGNSYERRNQFHRALDAFEAARKKNPESRYAQVRVAQIYERNRQFEKAIEEYQTALTKWPDAEDNADHRHRILDICYNESYWDNQEKARELGEAFFKTHPSAHIAYVLGYSYTHRNPVDYQKGLDWNLEYYKFEKIDAWHAGYNILDNYLRVGKRKEAAQFGQQWVAKFPRHPYVLDMMYRTAEAYRQTAERNNALPIFQMILRRWPKSNQALESALRSYDIPGPHRIPMLEQFIQANPDNYRLPEFYYRIGLVHQQEKRLDEALESYRLVWTKYRHKWAENMYCAWQMGEVLREQGKHEEARKVYEEITAHFGTIHYHQVIQAWLRLLEYYIAEKRPQEEIVEYCERVGQVMSGRRESIEPMRTLAQMHFDDGHYLDSIIALQKMVYLAPKRDDWSWDRMREVADARLEAARYGEAAMLYRCMARQNTNYKKDRVQDVERAMGSALSKTGAGFTVIDPNLEEAGLLWGNVFAQAGEEELAWQKYLDNKDLFKKYIHILHPEFVRTVVRRLLLEKEIRLAVGFARLFMVKHIDNKAMDAESKGQIQILLGDCYFRDERYDIARDEYATVVNIFKDTSAALDARFKIGVTLMAQKIFGKAQEIFEELATVSRDESVISRANLMLGILYHTMGERKKAEEQFKSVLALSPRHDTADEIIYRLGIVYHERGRYKEALDTLKLIGAYGGEGRGLLDPGTEFRIRLSDRNLNLTRGASDVPIIVEVTNEDETKGDVEKIYLTKSQAGAGLFVGGLYTELGEPKPNDHRLQVNGAATVTYRYEEGFARDFILAEKDRKMKQVVRIVSDAQLVAAATEIKDEEELEVDADMFANRQKQTESRMFRDEKQIKPGNPIYVRVKDGDRDRTNGVDTIEVVVSAVSGDSVTVPLEETGPHTGEFRGEVATGLRPADCFASDHAEGHDPRFAIDGSNEAGKAWIGRLDGRAPKWLAADLKEVFEVSRVEWHRGKGFEEGEDRRPLRYELHAATTRKNWELVARYPEDTPLNGMKVVWDPDSRSRTGPRIVEANGNIESRWHGVDGRTDWIIDLDLQRVYDLQRTILRKHDQSYEVRRYRVYVEKTEGEYPGQDRSLEGWERIHESPLLAQPSDDPREYEPDEARGRYLRILVTDKFHRYPEIGEFEVYPRLNSQVKGTEDQGGAAISFEPRRARFLKLVFREFRNDAPAIAELKVFDKDGKQLLPPEVDVHQLAVNAVLEMSPGDTVTAAYTDAENIYPGEPNTLRTDLEATFYNGRIRAIRHYFYEDQRGNRQMIDHEVFRVEAGERFIVEIREYDADQTDGLDKVPFIVRTSQGQELKLVATEAEPFSGVFTKEVDTSPEAKEGCLQVQEGDKVELVYWDEENNDPGNRTARIATLYENMPTVGTVYLTPYRHTTRHVYHDRRYYYDVPEYRPEMTGKLKFLSPEGKLSIAVYDPDAAVDTGKKIKVRLKTTAGAEVELECEFTYQYDRWGRQIWGGPEHKLPGLFAAHVDLALGDKESPNFRIEALRFDESVPVDKKEEVSTVPVLNVMGSDLITAAYLDSAVPDNPIAEERADHARIITDAEFGLFDSEYEEPVETAHLGEKLYFKVADPDADSSPERDAVPLVIETSHGDTLKTRLTETLTHSGIFTLALALEPGAANPENDTLEAQFGVEITAVYEDVRNTEKAEPRRLELTIPVVTGTDGRVMAFSRKYPTNDMAVETEFKIGECHYYLGRALLQNKSKENAMRHLAEGQQILSELVTHYPDAEYIDEATYLLGNVAQEQQKYFDAIRTYRSVIQKWPEGTIAADAQYKMAMCLEKLGRFDDACEEYVRLAYQYPQSPLVSDSMIRIGLYYFNRREYPKASSVFERFVEKYPDHDQVEKVSFKQGLCYILAGDFARGGAHFKYFSEHHPDSEMKPAALYWAGDAFLKANNAKQAFVMFKQVVWSYPDSKWAKYARGRLTAPIFDRIAEEL